MRSILFLSVGLFIFSGALTAQKNTSDIIVIPVVVHVVYNNSQQNISDDQIRSQIMVLNTDYRRKNKEITYIPQSFRTLAADTRIEFRLATTDPSGLSTNGIIRKNTSVPAFSTNDQIKFSSTGGDDAWSRDQYLNIWVGNISGGVLGYASSPGCDPAKDGVVIRYNAFGTTGTVKSPNHKGRTAVHEVGHWLGLKHIWGDEACGDDHIDDTPPQQGPTRGCPSGVVATCNSGASGNMYMNFMDFTNDDCISMFTIGQADKMHELFQNGGAREQLLHSGKAPLTEALDTPAAEGEISVFPNPAVDEINIRFNDAHEVSGKQVVIYNHLGQTAKRIVVTKRTTNISTRDLGPGMYFVSTGGKRTYKFIKL